MLALTHRQIAQNVFEAISSEFNIDVDMDSLAKGSIYPDKYPKKFFMGHSLDVSYWYVKDRINDLCKTGIPDNKKAMEEFSFKLGVIIHFVSDYFCQAHNDKEFKNIFKHISYEKKLKKYFTRRMNTFKPLFERKQHVWSKQESIISCINNKLKDYDNIRRSMTTDLVYSVGVSTAVALKIVFCCIQNAALVAA